MTGFVVKSQEPSVDIVVKRYVTGTINGYRL